MPPPYSAGSIFLQVVPSFRGVPEAIAREARNWDFSAAEKNLEDSLSKGAKKGAKKAAQDINTEMSKTGDAAGTKFSDGFSKSFERNTQAKRLFAQLEADAAKSAEKAGDAAGTKYTGKFRQSLRKGISDAQREVDALEIKFKDGTARRQLTELQVGLKGLDRNIEIGMDAGKAFIQLAQLEAKARSLHDRATDLEFRANIGQAIRGIETIRAGIESLSAMDIEPDLKLDRQLGVFERGLKGAVDNALRDLGTAKVGADSSAGERAVGELRRQLFELGDKTVGVDISAETARERLHQIRDELEALQREHWSVDLDANTAAAEANLAAFLAVLDRVDGRHVDVDVDVKDAVSAVTLLEGLERQSEKTNSAAKDLNSTMGQDGANSFRAFNTRVLGVAALGPLVIPALGGIAGGIGALLPLAAGAAAGIGVLVLGLYGLGNAFKAMSAQRESAGKDMITYGKGVDSAAKATRNAEESLASARVDAARANEAASEQVAQAVRGVSDAERGYRDAVKASQQAQQDLTRARKEAQDQLDELRLSVRDNALDQRQAVLDLHKAEKDLAEGRKNGAKGDDLAALVLAYDRAKLRIDQTKESANQLQVEQARWAKTGVEGSDLVVGAQQRVAASQRGVVDAQRRVKDAEAAVASARRDQARAAADGNRAVAQAQQGVTDALDQYSDALAKTSSSQDALDSAMAKLGPTGRAFVTWLDGMRPRLQVLRSMAQDGLLPGLAAWIDSIVNGRGPLLESAIGRISGALGEMFGRFATSIKGPAFGDLFHMINQDGPRFIGYMSQILVNLGEGIGSLTAALSPLGDIFGGWLIEATDRFRKWAASLSGSIGLQRFFDYIARVGPEIANFFWTLGDALLAIGKAVAPIAEGLMNALADAFAWIADLDPATLRAIVLGIVGVTLALQTIFGLTALAKSFTSALHITNDLLRRMGGSAPGIAAVGGQIGVFAGSMGILYSQSSLVRDAVNGMLNMLIGFGKWITGSLPNLKQLASTVIMVAAAWKAASILGKGLGTLGSTVTANAANWSRMAVGMTGSVDAGLVGLKVLPKLGGALSKVGSALPLVAIGFGIFTSLIEASNAELEKNQEQLNGWVVASHKGGAEAVEASKKLAKYQKEIADAKKAMDNAGQTSLDANKLGGFEGAAAGAFAAAQTGEDYEKLVRNLEKARQKYKDYLATLTPVQLAEANLAEATANVAYAVQQYGRDSDEARSAATVFGVKEQELKQIQLDVASATSGLNAELQNQLGIMLDLAGAELGYDQAVSSLLDARKRSADALKEFGANSKEYADALLAEEAQSRSTAEAAQKVAEARYQNADATTRQALGQAAYYLELERQKKTYGELPPRLEAIRAALQNSIDPAVLAAAKFYDLGLAVKDVPDTKTIILKSATDAEKKKLTDLGLTLTTLPDGTVKVEAKTDEAQKIIDEILKPKTLEVTVDIKPTKGEIVSGTSVAINRGGGMQGGGGPMGHASGGHIRGPGTGTSDSILARLSNGEYVVRAASVSKYGLPLLDAINQGRLTPSMKNGLPGFAGGGPVNTAQWGGTISLSGGNLNPLAGMWFGALQQIQSLSGQAAAMISNAFAGMKDSAITSFGQTKAGVLSHWTSLASALLVSAGSTRNGANSTFLNLRDLLLSRASETRDGVASRLDTMRTTAIGTITDAVTKMISKWAGLPGGVLGPVNTIIGKVLNSGLFKAFNGIISALGLSVKPIAQAAQVKLAAGGKVPGWSPHDKADNIPAMLTAGEYVHPVDSVDYYGPAFMEAIRKKRIPREALGIQRYADGGWVAMQNVIMKQFPWARITSAYRPGSPDYHGQGKAIDIGGAVPYPGSGSQPQMLMINRWIADHFRNITELIHTAPGAVNLWHGQPHQYNQATQMAHMNHVHWAMANGLGGSASSGLLATLGKLLGVGADLISDPVGFLKSAVTNALSGFETNPLNKILGGGARKIVDLVGDKLGGLMNGLFGIGDSSYSSGKSGAVVDQVRAVAARYGWDKGPEWDAIDWIINRESGWNMNAANPTSSARGLFQKMTSINGPIEGTASGQAGWGLNYMKTRYGTPTRAKAFWESHNWYGDGGPVQDRDSATGGIIPDLHDTGGWLQPGLNVIMNRTGRPEPTINPQTLDALQAIAARGAGPGGPFRDLVLHTQASDAMEVMDEAMHQVRVYRGPGKYYDPVG